MPCSTHGSSSKNFKYDYRMTIFQRNLSVPPANTRSYSEDALNSPLYQPLPAYDATDVQRLSNDTHSPNVVLMHSNTTSVSYTSISERQVVRTPSPTPSEAKALNDSNTFSLRKYLNPAYWFRRDRILYLLIIVAAIMILILFSVFDKEVVAWFEPIATKIRSLKAGFLIPIAILVILSFPPLFGLELIELFCGFVYGAGIGFGIAACGVLLVEIANFIAFKYFRTGRGLKLERTNIRYGAFAQVIREGGFKIAIIARYSAIPAHFATAVFATAGMNIFILILATILSLPKQFIKVYVGSVLAENGSGDESSSQSHKNKLIETVVLIGTIVITILAMRYTNSKFNEAKIEIIYKKRKERQLKLQVYNPVNAEAQAVAESNPEIIVIQPVNAARSVFDV